MMAEPSLLDEVMAAVESHRIGVLTWFEKLPPESQAALDAVRKTYDPKVHRKHIFARALIAAADKRGIPIAREKQVIKWLENQP
jgi:hypothetical protein